MQYFAYKTKKVRISGKSIDVEIQVGFERDAYDPGDAGGEAEIVEKINNGQIECGSIVVKAVALGEEGFDSLGQCTFSNRKEFMSYLKDHGMVERAIVDLKESFKDKIAVFREHGLIK